MTYVHIRLANNLATYCGEHGESMSLQHWHEHVVPNREYCCANLFARLCPKCDKLIPFRLQRENHL